MYIILVHISSQHVSCILKPLHLSHWREMLRVQTYGTRHGNVTRNLSYGRIMSRLNCSAISYVQLEKKLPSVILPQLTCKTLLVRTSIAWNVKSMTRNYLEWSARNPHEKWEMSNTNARSCSTKKHASVHYFDAIVLAAP